MSRRRHLESQGSKEPSVFAGVVALLEVLLNDCTGFLSGLRSVGVSARGGKGGNIDFGFDVIGEIKCVACRHDVVIVGDFDERGEIGSEGNLPLRHSLFDLSRILLHTGHYAMTVRMFVGTIVLALNDDSLLSGVSALEQDNDLSSFQTTIGLRRTRTQATSKLNRKDMSKSAARL